MSIEPTTPPAAASSADRQLHVIVAEDDEDMAYVVEFLLSREGFRVERYRDGRDAVRRITQGSPADAVVLDVMMPFVSGIHVVRTLRATPGWDTVPVVMVSGKASERDVVRALEAGANDYLTKPFRPKEFVARVRGLLMRGSAARAA